MEKSLTTEEFIERAKKIHGNRYDYSKVNYINAKTKVTIICKKHGEFEQQPNSHLNGRGCKLCGRERTNKAHCSTTEEFIEKAKKVHGNRYNYSKVNYVNNKTKVTIICKKHGEFEQQPDAHLSGSGCYKCGLEKLSKIKALTTEEFIERAKKIHGNRYNYSKVNYTNNNSKVELKCNKCGNTFYQIANDHLHNIGCPICFAKRDKGTEPSHLYYLSINNGEYYKIGVTTKPIEQRFYSLKLPYKVLLWKAFNTMKEARQEEQNILKKFDEFRYKGKEKILGNKNGNTELFTKDVLGLDKENK